MPQAIILLIVLALLYFFWWVILPIVVVYITYQYDQKYVERRTAEQEAMARNPTPNVIRIALSESVGHRTGNGATA